MSETKGVIYILTNPAFPQYVKIGYADDIEARLKSLNRSECIPCAFRVYATYKVNTRLVDIKLHNIIDKLNPSLRSIENFNGQKRVREFYAMTPEDAYAILEALAEIHDRVENLTLYTPSEQEIKAEKNAEEVDFEYRERASNFSFFNCNIKIGEQLEYIYDPSITPTVVSDKLVEYEGITMAMTTLAKKLTGKASGIAGPRYFKYKGELLSKLRERLGV